MSLWSRLANVVRGERLIREIDEELESHVAEAIAQGRDPAEARRAFGSTLRPREESRDIRRVAWLGDLLQDLRYGLRTMRRSPGVTAAAVLSLALGIGANTAIFSVVDALMWRPLPVPHPERLVRFGFTDDNPMASLFRYPEFEACRKGQQVFSDIAGVFDLDRSNITAGGTGAASSGRARVSFVSGTYFSTIGIPAAAGRTFTADDDRVPGGHPVAIISDAYWTRLFGRAPGVIGGAIGLNDVTYTIVGVAPRDFSGDLVGQPTDLWIPIAMESQVFAERPGLLSNPNPGWVRIVARLKPDVPIAQARAAVNVVFLAHHDLSHIDPRLTPKEQAAAAAVRLDLKPLGRGYSPDRRQFREPLAIIGVVVGLVLVIACSNVANLLLARSAARGQEMRVRLALGAGVTRIARQLLTESLLLSVTGGVAGLLVAWWGTGTLARVVGSGLNPLALDLRPDARVLGFAGSLSVLTGVWFGFAPAWRAMRTKPSLAVRTATGEGGSGFGVSHALVVAQVALSVVLLVGAALFVRTLVNLKSQDLGLDRQHVLLVWVPASEQGHKGAPVAALYQTAQDRIGALAGVVSASPSDSGLLAGGGGGSPITVPGHVRTDDEGYFARWNLIAPRFFETVGVKLIAGRDFTPRDTETSPRVAIINESMARHYFGLPNAVGQRFGMRRDTGNEIEIVGIVADAAIDSARNSKQRMIYLPYRQDLNHFYDLCLAVRIAGDPSSMSARITSELHAIDRSLPIRAITSLDEQLDRTLMEERLVAGLSVAFGLVAVVLTCVGLYGVMSYTSARRTSEIGVRLALGASRGGVIGLVLGSSLRLAVAGIVIGVPASWLLMRLVSARLFGISAGDSSTMAAAALLMLVVCGLAGFLPARRAANIDPAAALRSE